MIEARGGEVSGVCVGGGRGMCGGPQWGGGGGGRVGGGVAVGRGQAVP